MKQLDQRMIRRDELAIDGQIAHVWNGGEGDPLLLLHGAWGGAALHWSSVWEPLARRCRVIAPDFPGLASESAWTPASLDESVRWALGVLDACGARRAWITGNSFGAAVASGVASVSPERCLGLILIDGGPPPNLPAALRPLLRRWPLRNGVQAILRHRAFSASVLRRAFADPDRAPAEIKQLLARRHPRQAVITTRILLADGAPRSLPAVRTLIIWGSEDRLRGNTLKAGQRLESAMPNARLVVISGAGHLPQIEQPSEFTGAILDFVANS